MKILFCYSLMGVFVLASGGPAASAAEFRDLFNGKDLEGWSVEGARFRRVDGERKPLWFVEDGLLIADAPHRGGYGFLRYSKEEFGDFVFRMEFRLAKRGNSGLGIRTTEYRQFASRTTRASFYSYEIQLQDDAGRPPTKHSSGSLYRYKAPTTNAMKPAGEWNSIEVQCIGPQIKITMNGIVIMDVDQTEIEDLQEKPRTAPAPKDKALKGYISLQSHSNKVEFRNVQIKELGPASAGK